MTKYEKAVRVAVVCMEAAIQQLAVNANLQDKFNADLPQTISASKRRKTILEAIQTLKEGKI